MSNRHHLGTLTKVRDWVRGDGRGGVKNLIWVTLQAGRLKMTDFLGNI